jgi:hypothetical protein
MPGSSNRHCGKPRHDVSQGAALSSSAGDTQRASVCAGNGRPVGPVRIYCPMDDVARWLFASRRATPGNAFGRDRRGDTDGASGPGRIHGPRQGWERHHRIRTSLCSFVLWAIAGYRAAHRTRAVRRLATLLSSSSVARKENDPCRSCRSRISPSTPPRTTSAMV